MEQGIGVGDSRQAWGFVGSGGVGSKVREIRAAGTGTAVQGRLWWFSRKGSLMTMGFGSRWDGGGVSGFVWWFDWGDCSPNRSFLLVSFWLTVVMLGG